MRGVFTIYDSGPASHRLGHNTVAHFASHTVRDGRHDWMINDGSDSAPGLSLRTSLPSIAEELRLAAHMPAPRDPTGQKRWLNLRKFIGAVGGAALGLGTTENDPRSMPTFDCPRKAECPVEHVLNYSPDDLPRTINLVGSSRGAVTCIDIANALYGNPSTRDVDVNIFALDPVLGPASTRKVKLSPRVGLYRALVQLDEEWFIFPRKVITAQNSNTRIDIIRMPAGHYTAIPKITDVGKIHACLLYEFLEECGTSLDEDLTRERSNNRDLVEAYARVSIERWKYQRMSSGREA
jgi:hypothetical protein